MSYNTYPQNPFPPNSEEAKGEPYELPIASANVLGGVKVGNNLTIDANGALSAPAPTPAYTLPNASAETLGGVKVGNNLSIDENGVLSASNIFSTTPVIIGKWIDNKDLKRVVLPFDATSGSASIDVTSLNIDKAFCVGCFCQEEIYQTYNLAITPLYNSNDDKFTFQLNGARTAISVSAGNEKKGHGAIILCYTEKESEE